MASDGHTQPQQQPPRRRAGLYADLLGGSTSDASAQADSAAASGQQMDLDSSQNAPQPAKTQHISPAARLLQPIRRPQLAAKPKMRPFSAVIQKAPVPAVIQKAPVPAVKPPAATAAAGSSNTQGNTGVANQQSHRPTLDDWAAEDNDEEATTYLENRKRQRAAERKNKKQKQHQDDAPRRLNWHDIYDINQPSMYEDFRHCEEKHREINDWKYGLHSDRLRPAADRYGFRRDSDMSYGSSNMSRSPHPGPSVHRSMFAPPASYSDEEEDKQKEITRETTFAKPPPPTTEIPNDATGEDAYARRMRMSAMSFTSPAAPVPREPAPGTIPYQVGTITRAPVRYDVSPAPVSTPSGKGKGSAQQDLQDEDTPMPDSDAGPSGGTPFQKKFGQKMLEKMGWNKGEGLGAKSSGIVKPLSVQMDKRKKRSDAQGGGFIGPAGKGRIVGGSKSKATRDAEKEEDSKTPQISSVVILQGMTKGLDLDAEIRDGNLMQDIGDECSKQGRIERVFIDRDSEGNERGANVFIKFTAQLSALNAVQALDGRIFNGNKVTAKYYDEDKFDSGDYSAY